MAPSPTFMTRMHQMNDGRGLGANALGFFCVACVLGIANMFSRSAFHQDMGWLLRPALVMTALYFFIPWLLVTLSRKNT